MPLIRVLLVLVSLALSLLTGALAFGAMLDPTGSQYAMIASTLWAPFGPHLAIAAIIGLLLALLAIATGARRTGRAALGLSVAASAASLFIVARIVAAIWGAGGSVDLAASLLPAPMAEPAPDRVETVATVEGVTLSAALYLPKGGAAPAPVIVYIHGGGFMAGTSTETAADLAWFAARGFLVVSVDYRLFAPGRPTWDKAMPDAACGLAWAHANAARFGGDPGRIALFGDSAGGNLAINIGFAAADGRAVSGCGGTVPPVQAIAVLYPAVDPQSIYENGFPVPGFAPTMLIEGFLGGPPADHPDRLAAVASESFITDKAPPTLIVSPDNDSLVVADGVRRFAEKARGAGAPLELVRIPFANHIFNQIAADTLGNQAGRTIRLRFLREVFG